MPKIGFLAKYKGRPAAMIGAIGRGITFPFKWTQTQVKIASSYTLARQTINGLKDHRDTRSLFRSLTGELVDDK